MYFCFSDLPDAGCFTVHVIAAACLASSHLCERLCTSLLTCGSYHAVAAWYHHRACIVTGFSFVQQTASTTHRKACEVLKFSKIYLVRK